MSNNIINNNLNNYVTTLSGDYSKLFGSSYVLVTYYKIDDLASIYDDGLDEVDHVINTLESVHSQTGVNSPIKYKRIKGVPLYNIQQHDISTSLTERGLESSIDSSAVVVPNTVVPVAGDFFVFEIDDYREHIFEVRDVQQSSAGSLKFYNIQYGLFKENAEILDKTNISEDYRLLFDNIGSNDSPILTEESAAFGDEIKSTIEHLITDYTGDYFDENMNMFIYRGQNPDGSPIYLWSQYLQHFLKINSVLTSYQKKVMKAIYIIDINRSENSDIYDEHVYKSSIFESVTLRRNLCNKYSGLGCVSSKNIRVRNLPFFSDTGPYRLLDMGITETNPDGLPSTLTNGSYGVFPFLYANNDKTLSSPTVVKTFNAEMRVDEDGIKHFIDDGILLDVDGNLMQVEDNDIIYEMKDDNSVFNKLYPHNTYITTIDNGRYINISADISSILANNTTIPENSISLKLLSYVQQYISGSLSVTAELLTWFKETYFEPSTSTYILVPIMIYILKQEVAKL